MTVSELESVTDRGLLLHYAKYAEAAERYQDMADAMKRIIELNAPLDIEERNLFSVAYKYIVGERRKSWRIVTSFKARDTPSENNAVADLKKKIEKELDNECKQVVTLIDKFLVKNDTSDGGKVFYYKMKGDYYRYMAEVETGDARKQVVELASKAYQDATVEAESTLLNTNPIRLGLALNYSVYFYEIELDPAKACKLAQDALDASLKELEESKQKPNTDTELILQLLRDNLSLWSAERDAEQ